MQYYKRVSQENHCHLLTFTKSRPLSIRSFRVVQSEGTVTSLSPKDGSTMSVNRWYNDGIGHFGDGDNDDDDDNNYDNDYRCDDYRSDVDKDDSYRSIRNRAILLTRIESRYFSNSIQSINIHSRSKQCMYHLQLPFFLNSTMQIVFSIH